MSEMNLLQGSKAYKSLKGIGTAARQTAAEARSTQLARAITTVVDRAVASSRFGAANRTLAHWTRSSRLFRWLTAEPDPDVVVIDLRKTWTVAPFLAVVEWAGNWLGKYGSGAGTRTLLQRGVAIVAKVAQGSIVVDVLAAIFEPPEPPEQDGRQSNRNNE